MDEIVVKNNTVAKLHYTGTLPDSGGILIQVKANPLTF